MEENFDLENEKTERSKAIDTSSSVWVSASAGTGKTRILTNRVLKLLMDKIDPDRILCLTFTNAASGEMKQRINSSLKKWSILDQEDLRLELSDLLQKNPTSDELDYARNIYKNFIYEEKNLKIFTIHAFCRSILEKFPFEAGIKNDFKIIDEYSSHMLLNEALDEVIQSEKFSKLIADLSEITSIFRIKEVIFEAVRKILAKNFENYRKIDLKKFLKIEEVDLDFNCLVEIMFYKIKNLFDFLSESEKEIFEEKYNFASILSKFSTELNIFHNLNITNKAEAKANNSLKNPDIFEEFYNSISEIFITKERKKRQKKLFLKDVLKKNPNLDDISLKIMDSFMEIFEKVELINIYKRTDLIYNIAFDVISVFKTKKNDQNLLDYNDLIRYSYNLLNNSENRIWVQYKLDGGIDHILLDEAQDTSREQWNIIYSLFEDFLSGQTSDSSCRTIFVVGDVKQSIYGFQGARPDLFVKMRSEISHKIHLIGKNFHNINLNLTYRLTPAILKVVTNLFSKIENFQFSKIQNSSRVGDYGSVEIFPVIISENSNDFFWNIVEEKDNFSDLELISKEIAKYIKNTINNKIFLPSKGRYARESDFLILVSKRSELNKYLEKELILNNIDYAGADRLNIIRHISVMDLISAARFTYLRDDDLNLASLLKSPIFNFTDTDLYHLINNYSQDNKRNLSLYNKLIQSDKYQHICEKLNYLTQISKTNYSKFFHKIVTKFQLLEYYDLRSEYDSVDAINEFLNLADNLIISNKFNLNQFVNFCLNKNITLKRELSSSNSVKIMTVHGSKGLQSPVVIIADKISTKSLNNVFLDVDNDNVPFLWSKDSKIELINEIKKENSDKDLNEKLRLLYVAMTRAEDRLIIFASSKKDIDHSSDILEKSWFELIDNSVKNLIAKIPNEQNIDNLENSDEDENVNRDILKYEFGDINYDLSKNNSILGKKISEFNLVKYIKFENFINTNKNENNRKNKQIFEFNPLNFSSEFGSILHKLIEDYVAYRDYDLLKNHNLLSNLTLNDKSEILSVISSAIYNPIFQNFFHFSVKAEVNMGAYVDGKFTLMRLDLMVFYDDKILIIDYKSDLNPLANTKQDYINQLNNYMKAVKFIYPNFNIEAAIFWLRKSEFEFLGNNEKI